MGKLQTPRAPRWVWISLLPRGKPRLLLTVQASRRFIYTVYQSNAMWPVGFWSRTSSPQWQRGQHTTTSQISDISRLAVTTATARWPTQTSLHLQKGRINHSNTFIAIWFCYFFQISNTFTQELHGLLGFHHLTSNSSSSAHSDTTWTLKFCHYRSSPGCQKLNNKQRRCLELQVQRNRYKTSSTFFQCFKLTRPDPQQSGPRRCFNCVDLHHING